MLKKNEPTLIKHLHVVDNNIFLQCDCFILVPLKSFKKRLFISHRVLFHFSKPVVSNDSSGPRFPTVCLVSKQD